MPLVTVTITTTTGPRPSPIFGNSTLLQNAYHETLLQYAIESPVTLFWAGRNPFVLVTGKDEVCGCWVWWCHCCFRRALIETVHRCGVSCVGQCTTSRGTWATRTKPWMQRSAVSRLCTSTSGTMRQKSDQPSRCGLVRLHTLGS